MSKVRLKQLESQADSGVLIYDANGDPIYLGPGQDQYPLVGRGPGVAPEFKKLPLGGLDIAGSAPGEHLEISPGGIAAWLQPTAGGWPQAEIGRFTLVANGTAVTADGEFSDDNGGTGFPSIWHSWKSMKISPVRNGDGFDIGLEILSRLGPGCSIMIYRTSLLSSTPETILWITSVARDSSGFWTFSVLGDASQSPAIPPVVGQEYAFVIVATPAAKTYVFSDVHEVDITVVAQRKGYTELGGYRDRVMSRVLSGDLDHTLTYLGPVMPEKGVVTRVRMDGVADATRNTTITVLSRVRKTATTVTATSFAYSWVQNFVANEWFVSDQDLSENATAKSFLAGDQIGFAIYAYNVPVKLNFTLSYEFVAG